LAHLLAQKHKYTEIINKNRKAEKYCQRLFFILADLFNFASIFFTSDSNSTAMQPAFIHLRLHTEFSLVDGIVKIKPLVKRMAELNMPAIAVTDHTNLFSVVTVS